MRQAPELAAAPDLTARPAGPDPATARSSGPDTRRSQPHLWLRLALSLVITAAIVLLVAREWGAVPDDLRVPAWAVPTYLASLVFYFFARAGRFWFLVRPLGRVGFRDLLLVAFAGFLWILLLPWRLGEFVRPQLLAQVSRPDPAAPPTIGFPQALGAVAVERVVDGLVVCAMFFATTSATRDAPGLFALHAACIGAATLFGGALAVLLALAVWPRAAGAVLSASLGRLAPRLAARLAELARGISGGLAALPSPRWLVLFVLATLAYWAANALGMYLLARGCGLDLAPAQAVAVLAVLNLTLLVPGPPAHVGTFQLGVLTGLALYLPAAVVADAGVVYAFYLYVCQVGMIAVLGTIASLRLRWGFRATLAALRTGSP